LNRSFAIIVLLLCIIISETAFYLQLYNRYAGLQQEHAALTLKYETLSSQFVALNSSYYNLISDFNELSSEFAVLNETYLKIAENYSEVSQHYGDTLSKYNELEAEFTSLNAAYTGLLVNYDQLEKDYQQLNGTYAEALSELSANYTSLQNAYNQLNVDYQDTEQAYSAFVDSYAKLVRAVNLHSVHPTPDETSLITPFDDAVVAEMLEITGGWSNQSDWNEFWQDVYLMYRWVKDNIIYRSDGDYPVLPDQPNGTLENWPEMWQYPTETLALGKGDCEDMAILLTSLTLAYSNETVWTEVIVITQHAAVYIPVSPGQICILDVSGNYYTNTGSPSYTITSKGIDQEVNKWLDYWNSHGISNPQVQWIFSSYIWQQFDSTDAFINWLYGRT